MRPNSLRYATGLMATTLVLLASGSALAQTAYQARVVLRVGDVASDARIPANAGFQVGDMNDAGHLAIVAGTVTSGSLIQIADGQATAIAVADLPTLNGSWPNPLLIGLPLDMNDAGNIVFFTESGSPRERATFFWDRAARRATTIAERGGAGPGGVIWADGGYFSPSLNNANEIAFPAGIADPPAGVDYGVFLRSPSGSVSAVAVPSSPDSDEAFLPSIDDAGRIAYLTLPEAPGFRYPNAAYLWERGGTTRLAGPGTTVGGAPVAAVSGVWTNNANRNLLLLVHTDLADTGPRVLLRYVDGALTTIVATGSELPGGGRLRNVVGFGEGVSQANAAGQHAFIALLEDGTQAAYLLDASGQVSLIMRQGAQTSAGRVTAIAPDQYTANAPSRSYGIALNGRGQVLLPVQLDGGINAVLLLTPETGTGTGGGTGGGDGSPG